ncbi:MAG: LuxR C-terminal-related transcriptional regulator [Vicinamibacterales bacterium]
MPTRLRVLLVGGAASEVADLRRRLSAGSEIDIVGERLLGAETPSAVALAPEVELVVMSPRTLAALSMRRSTRARDTDESDDDLVEALTRREHDVLALVADGLGNRDVASSLGISEHTVKFHLASIFGKLGASSRTEAVQRGLRLGLIEI